MSPSILMRLAGLALAILVLLTGCNLPQSSGLPAARQTEMRATELDLNVQQTLIAQQSTLVGPAQTQIAQRTQQAGKLAAQTATALAAAQEPAITTPPAATDTQAAATSAPAEPSPTPVPSPTQDLGEQMKKANIVVYEDMVARSSTSRYVKETLLRMGLPFKDDGNAGGWLMNDLAQGAPNGQAWDLIIVAAEDKDQKPPDYYDNLLQAIDQGSSVIIETWDLDKTAQGVAKNMLARCGIQFQLNWIRIPPAQQVMFAHHTDHPILNEPNQNLAFTHTTSYWWDENGARDYDIGDLVQPAPGSQAPLLLTIKPAETNTHGTLTVCMEGKLILQTFSSHSMIQDTGTLIWENYIYNALRARFQ